MQTTKRLVATLSIVCMLATPAAAQSPDQEKADQFFAEGRDLLVKHNDPIGACKKFEQAIALDPTAPGVMLNLGLCYKLQEKFATSLYWFRKAQFAAAEANPPLVDYEQAAKDNTQLLAQQVLLGRIDVSQAPPGVRISIDGRLVRPEDYLRLEVDKDSVIEARAHGKQVFRQAVEVDGPRSVKDVVIVMKDEPLGPLRDPGKLRRRIAYVAGATGIVLWGATLAYGLTVRSKYQNMEDPYDQGDAYDKAKHDLRYYTTGMFIAGTAAVGAAVYLYLSAPKPYHERAQQAVTPVITPDHVGIGYARSF